MRLQGASRPIHRISSFAGALLAAVAFSLAGCQSSQEQRIEEAKDLIRQKQMLETQYGKQGDKTPVPPVAVSPSQPADPSKSEKAAPADSLGMPLYPGARSVSHLGNT